MNNLIDFNEHLKNKNISKIENIKIYTNKEDINFEFTLLTDFVLNKLYINLKFPAFCSKHEFKTPLTVDL